MFPLFIVDPVFRQLVKILPSLRAVIHIVAEKFDRRVFFITVEQLPARHKAFEHHLFFPLLHHRKMADIIRAFRFILADKLYDLQIVALVFCIGAHLLAPAHHHASHRVSAAVV